MIKIYNVLLTSIILGLLMSCSSFDERGESTNTTQFNTITAETPEYDFEADTRTTFDFSSARFLWSSGDRVGIISDAGSQLCFPIRDEDSGKPTASFNGRGWGLLSSSKYLAYYPFIPDYDLDYSSVPVSYLDQIQIGNNDYSRLGNYAFWVATGVSPEEGNLHFSFKDVGGVIRFTIPAFSGNYQQITLSISELLFTSSGFVDLSSGDGVIVNPERSDELCLKLSECEISEDGSSLIGYLMTAPLNLTGSTLSVIAEQEGGTSSISAIAGRDFVAGKAFNMVSKMTAYPYEQFVGSGAETIEVKLLTDNVSATMSSNDTWITPTSSSVNSKVTTYTFNVAENTGAERVGTISFTEASTGLVNTVKVTQQKAGTVIGIGGWNSENRSGRAN
ncbi:MAG: BACON domain-containing protein [Bacteroidales bacterium]|nr:BACON domain-containing protein [Bacteroidales bacterium]